MKRTGWRNVKRAASTAVLAGIVGCSGTTGGGGESSAASQPSRLWVIGLNASGSVDTRHDSKPVLAQGVTFACGLDPSRDQVIVVKVFKKVQVVVPMENAPFGKTQTLKRWLRALAPFPEPSTEKGTRNDLFWLKVAEIAKDAGPGVQVVGVVVGDGFGENCDTRVYKDASAKLLNATNYAGCAYIGMAPGAFEEISWRMRPLVEARKVATFGEVRRQVRPSDVFEKFSEAKQ